LQTLRVNAVTNGWNLNWIELAASAEQPETVNIPVTGPYAQYLEIGLSPADLNGVSALRTQNTTVNHTLSYRQGDAVTLRVNYIVEQKQVQFKATDENGNSVQGNPLTFTVGPDSAVSVEITDQAVTAAPVFTPGGGTYDAAQEVTISCDTADAVIRYTTDGSVPGAASAVYNGPIPITSTTTLKAYASSAGLADSAVTSATYYIGAGTANLALGKSGQASSYLGGNRAAAAFDGNGGTRWESEFSDPQWIYVDLGASYWVSGVKLNWEAASGKEYKIQVSGDASEWQDVYNTTNGSGGEENIVFEPAEARYVRMYGTVRNTPYGYSLWEFGRQHTIDKSTCQPGPVRNSWCRLLRQSSYTCPADCPGHSSRSPFWKG